MAQCQGYDLIQFLFTVPKTWLRLVLSVNRYPSNKRTNSLLFVISKCEKQLAFQQIFLPRATTLSVIAKRDEQRR